MFDTIVTYSDLSRPTGSVLLSNDPAALLRIREPGISLAVYRRQIEPRVQKFVDEALLPLTLKRVISATDASEGPAQLLEGIGRPQEAQPFLADVRALTEWYLQVSGTRTVNLKLECLAGNLCERFHTDRVPLRLICSYAGPGTEWLANEDIDRSWLGPRAGERRDKESGLLREGAAVQKLERFAVGLMKGDLWPGNQGKGLVHRSPHDPGGDQRRVLFKIDAD